MPAVRQLLKKLAWYPPAETKIPLTAIFSSFFSLGCDFEKTLCNYLQIKHCILGNSGRALLALLLAALKKKDGGVRNEVLIPGYTCYSVAASVAKAGLKIRVYDMDPQTLEPDLDCLRSAVSSKILAIVSQHLFGIPTPIDGLKEITQEAGANFIEDVAQAFGATLNGRPLGTMGDFGFYSFGRGKPLPLGCGGALIGKDLEILSELDLKPKNKGYGSLMASFVSQIMSKPSFYWIPEILPIGLGETIFVPGFEVAAMPHLYQRLAEKSMAVLDDLNTHRSNIANVYNKVFDHECVIPVPDKSTPVNLRFPLMAGSGPIPAELKRLGVRRMYPKAIAAEETIKPYLPIDPVPTPGAAQIAQKLITLPTHLGITENLAKEIAQKVKLHNWK